MTAHEVQHLATEIESRFEVKTMHCICYEDHSKFLQLYCLEYNKKYLRLLKPGFSAPQTTFLLTIFQKKRCVVR